MMENPINPPVAKKPTKDVREDPLDLWRDSYDVHKYQYITY